MTGKKKTATPTPVKMFLKTVYWLLIIAIFGSVLVLAYDAYLTYSNASKG
ncbi:hypothetical protein [Catenovulum sediminis]|uniref:Uncharacterized protein n=1 Tax=Catenovulum sediminis TaxID=1740262 RepID=A0ABV1RH55_9ALTE|nr:hypothetical protein [Catenovulum sediminis]